MVPKIHAKGTSFKGAAAYLLHDKGSATTDERVAWVETVNLATRNSDTAWRVMAATAMDAGRLKQLAGVKKTGRQSKDAVLHISLSWSPDQTPDRADMAAFARRALEALKAEDRQAMIICHRDEKHAHVHLLVNRVSPADGRLLSSSNEKNALSALALAYEKEGGKVLCEKRQENAERREKGEYVRAEKDVPRDEFEALRDTHEAAEAEVPAGLQADRPDEIAALRRASLATFREKLAELRQQLRVKWSGLYADQRREQREGQQEKDTFTERVAERLSGSAPSLPFLRATLRGAAVAVRVKVRQQQGARADLARTKRNHLAQLVCELKQGYAQAIGTLRGVYGRVVRPASDGDEGRAITPAQRRALDINRSVADRSPTRPGDRDREYEP